MNLLLLVSDTEESGMNLDGKMRQNQQCSGDHDHDDSTHGISEEVEVHAPIAQHSNGSPSELRLLRRKLVASNNHIASLENELVEMQELLAEALSSKDHNSHQVSKVEAGGVSEDEISKLPFDGGVSEDELEQGSGQTMPLKGDPTQSRYRKRANRDARSPLEATAHRRLLPCHLEPLKDTTRRKLNPSSCASGIALLSGQSASGIEVSSTASLNVHLNNLTTSRNNDWGEDTYTALRNGAASKNPFMDMLSKFA